ncbi:MAG: single-stranded-DNA-specific exonuclease RecJ [Pseudomonadota bacterium]
MRAITVGQPNHLPDDADRSLVLNVSHSVTGKRWEERSLDSSQALALSQRLGLPEAVGRVMAGRDVSLETADSYLSPTLRSLMPDPASLKGMSEGVARLADAIQAGEKIAVFGDYDVDGATSSALLRRFGRLIGVDVEVYIPDRVKEGYGPNEAALLKLRREGADVLVTVDCGITAFDPLAAAREAGLDMVVLDHHAAEARLPDAVAVINPNRLDDTTELGHLAAVGVTFLFLVGLNRAFRDRCWYQRQNIAEPDLRQLLDLVALGTVCDVVPLKGLNRAFVTQGLKVMAHRGNIGLASLCDVAGVDSKPDSYHAGFLLGPRVNAGGRVGEAGLGARLLTCDDPTESHRMAQRLDQLNGERRQIESQVLDQAIASYEADTAEPSGGLIFVAGENWHPGVIGIVASRLKDRYNGPAIVVGLEGEVGKGSGRSVPGVDLGAAVIAARQAGLLINGGGHAMAAGLTVARDAIAELQAFLDQHLGRQLRAVNYRPALKLDGALQAGGANGDLMRDLDACGPFGMGNPQPRFAFPSVRIQRPGVVGGSHVRCTLIGPDGTRLKAIAFRALDTPLGDALLTGGSLPLHLAGRLNWDSWAGPEAVQLIIDDAAFSSG